MKPEFHFDPVRHIYTLGGVKIPSHSEISNLLFGSGYYPKDDNLPLDRGTYIHECCKLYLQERLDIESLIKDRDEGWIISLRKGLYSLGFRSLGINSSGIIWQKIYAEVPIYCENPTYGITPDTVFPDQKTIVEFKTGGIEKEKHAMQLMAQCRAAQHYYGIKCNRLVVLYLRPDGTFKKSRIYRFNPRIFSVFQSGIITWNCRNKRIKFDL